MLQEESFQSTLGTGHSWVLGCLVLLSEWFMANMNAIKSEWNLINSFTCIIFHPIRDWVVPTLSLNMATINSSYLVPSDSLFISKQWEAESTMPGSSFKQFAITINDFKNICLLFPKTTLRNFYQNSEDQHQRCPTENCSIYFNKVLKQVCSNMGVSSKATCIENYFIKDIVKHTVGQDSLSAHCNRPCTIASRES